MFLEQRGENAFPCFSDELAIGECFGCFVFLFVLRMIYLISIRPIRMYRWTATGVTLVTITSVQWIPWTILTTVPASIWIIFFNYWWLFLDDLKKEIDISLVKSWINIFHNENQELYSIFTSVRAQLQLIAVHKKMFISNMMRNRMPSVMQSQRSHDGRIPPSSHAGEITENDNIFK